MQSIKRGLKMKLEPSCYQPAPSFYEMSYKGLCEAASIGDEKACRELLDAGVELQQHNRFSPLIRAAENGHLRTVRLLIARGAKINAKSYYGDTALMFAAQNGHTQIVDLLLEKKASIHLICPSLRNSSNALTCAARNGHTEVMELLINKGANVNTKDPFEETTLVQAARNGQAQAVDLLLNKGADVNAKNAFGETPLILATRAYSLPLVGLLLEKGAEINAKNSSGETALTLAERYYEIPIMKHLLVRGAHYDRGCREYERIHQEVYQAQCSAFMLGLHDRVGKDSSVKRYLITDDLSERNLYRIITGFINPDADSKPQNQHAR